MIQVQNVNGRNMVTHTTKDGKELSYYGDVRSNLELSEGLGILTSIQSGEIEAPEFEKVISGIMMKYEEENLNNIRDILGCFIGKTITDVTQHDEEEYLEGEDPYIMLMFTDGSVLKLNAYGLDYFNSEDGSGMKMYLGEPEDEDLDAEDED